MRNEHVAGADNLGDAIDIHSDNLGAEQRMEGEILLDAQRFLLDEKGGSFVAEDLALV